MDIPVGDEVQLIGTDITGTVDDVTATMSHDDRTLEAVAVRIVEDASGRPTRVIASELEIIRDGSLIIVLGLPFIL